MPFNLVLKTAGQQCLGFNPFAPGNFAEKCKASQAVFRSMSFYKEVKLTIKPFTDFTLRGLLIQMQNIA